MSQSEGGTILHGAIPVRIRENAVPTEWVKKPLWWTRLPWLSTDETKLQWRQWRMQRLLRNLGYRSGERSDQVLLVWDVSAQPEDGDRPRVMYVTKVVLIDICDERRVPVSTGRAVPAR